MLRGLLLCALFCAPARAQDSKAEFRLAVVEPASISAGAELNGPIERLLRTSSATIRLLDIQTVPCYHSGNDYRLRLPPAAGADDSARMSAVALESPSEAALIFPPDPSLIEELRAFAEDPASYQRPWLVRLSTKTLTLSQTRGPAGEALITALLDPAAGEGAQWLPAFAEAYRLNWRGREISIVVVAKLHGGLGRLATLLARERKRGPFIGVARSDAFGSGITRPTGRALAEKLESFGLKYSAVGSAEVRRWKEVAAYIKDRPDGIQFLSANLVYSSATGTTLLPDHAVVESGGAKLCLVGMTPPEAAKYLSQGGLPQAQVLDPVVAFQQKSASLRKQCDLVAILGALTPEASRLRFEALGADLILAEDYESPVHAAQRPESGLSNAPLYDFDQPAWVMKYWDETLNRLDLSLKRRGGSRYLDLKEIHETLDEAVPWALSVPPFVPENFATVLSTEAPLLPAARRIFTADDGAAFPQITDDKFWSMAASLLADQTGSEVGLLRVLPLPIQQDSDLPESVVETWLEDEEQAVVVTVPGGQLKSLLAEARAQKERRAKGLPKGSSTLFTAGGIGPDDKIHGVPIDDAQKYRVATTQVLADSLDLPKDPKPAGLGRTADQIVLDALLRRRGAPPSDYGRWMQGRPVTRRGLWKLNFRDVSLNLQDTQVIRDDAFNSVPNSRIQGFSQFVVGGDVKTDADYLYDPYKWSNTVEMEYAQSQISPRGQPHIINTPANRIMGLTSLTRKAGTIKEKWLAESWGPSLGFEYDSEFVASPGLPRKQVYNLFPGIELYDGSFIHKWELSANIRRDQSRIPPNTQGGLHTRMLFSHEWGKAPASLQGEWYANYFFLTHQDTVQDLRFETDFNLKLKIPIKKYLTIAPFLDIYVFELKARPIMGYSSMLGLSIGFSRLWKPQYESF